MPQVVDAPFARGFLQRLHEAANAHDAESVAALCCEDVVWEDPAAPKALYGRDAVLRFHRDIMFPALPDTHIELIDGPYLALDGTGVAARLRISGTMTGSLTPPGFAPTGGKLTFETAEFSHFRDGLLARHTVVLNMLDLARQIGAVPQAGTLGDRIGVWLQHVAAFWARGRQPVSPQPDGPPSMRAQLLATLLVLCVWAAAASGASAADKRALVLSNVTLVDIERNRVESNRDVVIVGDRIVGIQAGGTARASKRGRVLDGAGKFLMPGLWDFHVHVFSAPSEEDFALPLYILNGITGVRDAGALRSLPEQQRIAAAIERGERAGPRLVLAGALIDGPPGSWPGQMVASTPDEGRQRVREAKAAGWRFIKSYSLLGEPTFLAIAEEARRQRLPLFGHIPESVRLETAVSAGHRSIEHFGRVTQACAREESAMISANALALKSPEPLKALMAVMMGHNRRTLESWDEKLCASVVRRLASANVAVMPSLMVSDFYLGKDPAVDDARMRSVPRAVREQWGQGDWRRQQIPPELLAQAPRSVALDWKTFKIAHDAGVPILAGTDASFANPFLFHGFTLHDELQRYVEAGLTPQQALLTATVQPGRFLRRSDLAGRVAIRQKADLVMLDANPLIDIAATRRIHAVVANGRLFDRAALDALRLDLEARAAK